MRKSFHASRLSLSTHGCTEREDADPDLAAGCGLRRRRSRESRFLEEPAGLFRRALSPESKAPALPRERPPGRRTHQRRSPGRRTYFSCRPRQEGDIQVGTPRRGRTTLATSSHAAMMMTGITYSTLEILSSAFSVRPDPTRDFTWSGCRRNPFAIPGSCPAYR